MTMIKRVFIRHSVLFLISSLAKKKMITYSEFLGDPAKQEAPQEETAFVRSAVRHDLSSKAYNSASLGPIILKF